MLSNLSSCKFCKNHNEQLNLNLRMLNPVAAHSQPDRLPEDERLCRSDGHQIQELGKSWTNLVPPSALPLRLWPGNDMANNYSVKDVQMLVILSITEAALSKRSLFGKNHLCSKKLFSIKQVKKVPKDAVKLLLFWKCRLRWVILVRMSSVVANFGTKSTQSSISPGECLCLMWPQHIVTLSFCLLESMGSEINLTTSILFSLSAVESARKPSAQTQRWICRPPGRLNFYSFSQNIERKDFHQIQCDIMPMSCHVHVLNYKCYISNLKSCASICYAIALSTMDLL